MKKLLLVLVLFLLLTTASIKSVSAEEVEDIPTSSPSTEEVIENEELPIEEENTGTNLQLWVNENLGWLIGIPTGISLSAVIEFILIAKLNKKKREEIAEVQEQRSVGDKVLSSSKKMIEDTKLLTANLKDSVSTTLDNVKTLTNTLQNNVNNALSRIETLDVNVQDTVNNLANKLSASFEQINKTVTTLESRLAKLENIQEMIALHTKELVANGTAEEIVKKIRG
jgi:predicted RNase H-like nuclease (RuvC/YqgF family)